MLRLIAVVAASVLLFSELVTPVPAQVGTPAERSGRGVTPRRVLVVHPLAYYNDASGQPVGECLAARLEIGGAPAGRVRIGVYEPEVGGTTDVWRAATWSAALVAAQLTNFDPRALQLSVESRRSTDGPSAGALLTVGLVATIRGDQLRDDVTMTGTINPDGTIGPVGGVPMKIDGAARAGKKIVLIPYGIDEEVDPRTGAAVNLVQYGWRQDLDVRQVRDIREAYEVMTGVAIPQPKSGDLPELSPEIHSLMADRIPRWIKLTKAARDKYYSWPDYTHSEWSEGIINQSREAFDRGQAYLDAGDITAAYMEAVTGALYSWMGHEFGRYVYSLPSQGVASLNQLPMQNGWLIKEINETSVAMRSFKPRTFDQMAMYLNAGLVYFEGLCAYEIAEDMKLLHQSAYIQLVSAGGGNEFGTADELRQVFFSVFSGVFQIVAWIDMKLATDYLELAAAYGGSELPQQPPLVSVADFYRRGAEANMTIVNQLALIPAAQQQEMPVDVARAILPIGDAYFGTAHVGLTRVLPNLSNYLGEGEQLDYVRLAAGMYLHSVTSTLIAKYYSIGVEYGDDLSIASINRPEALDDWIAASRKQTEGSIHALIDKGLDASTCLQMYWLGRVREKQRQPHERFEALQTYFNTNLMAQMLVQLATSSTAPESQPRFDDGSAPFPPPEPTDDQSLPPPPQPTDDIPPPPTAPKVK